MDLPKPQPNQQQTTSQTSDSLEGTIAENNSTFQFNGSVFSVGNFGNTFTPDVVQEFLANNGEASAAASGLSRRPGKRKGKRRSEYDHFGPVTSASQVAPAGSYQASKTECYWPSAPRAAVVPPPPVIAEVKKPAGPPPKNRWAGRVGPTAQDTINAATLTVPWGMRDTNNASKYHSATSGGAGETGHAATIRILSSRYLWWKILFAIRYSCVAVLPIVTLIAATKTSVAFVSKSFAGSGALLTINETFGGSVKSVFDFAKSACLTIPLVTIYIWIGVYKDPYAWSVLFVVAIIVGAFTCEGLSKKMALMVLNITLVGQLHAYYDGVGLGATITYPCRIAAEYLMGAVFGVISTLVPFPKFASRRVDDKLKEASANLSLCFAGLCDTFWTTSNLQRRINMVRIHFAQKTAMANLEDCQSLMDACGFEPQTLDGYYLRVAKYRLLNAFPTQVEATLRVLEAVSEDPFIVHGSAQAMAFGEHLADALAELAGAVEAALFLIANAKSHKELVPPPASDAQAQGRLRTASIVAFPVHGSPNANTAEDRWHQEQFGGHAHPQDAAQQQRLRELMAVHPLRRVRLAMRRLEATFAKARRDLYYTVKLSTSYPMAGAAGDGRATEFATAEGAPAVVPHDGANDNDTAAPPPRTYTSELRRRGSGTAVGNSTSQPSVFSGIKLYGEQRRRLEGGEVAPLPTEDVMESTGAARRRSALTQRAAASAQQSVAAAAAAGCTVVGPPSPKGIDDSYDMPTEAQEFSALMAFYIFTLTQFSKKTLSFPTSVATIRKGKTLYGAIFDELWGTLCSVFWSYVEAACYLLPSSLVPARCTPALCIAAAVRMREAIKFSAAMGFSMLFYYYTNREYAFLVGPSVLCFIASTTSSEALYGSMIRLFGTLFGGIIGFFCARITHDPLEKVIACVVVIFFCAFFRTGKQYGGAAFYACFVVIPMLAPNVGIEEAISRITQITFATMIYTIITIAVFPTKPMVELGNARVQAIATMVGTLGSIMDAFASPFAFDSNNANSGGGGDANKKPSHRRTASSAAASTALPHTPQQQHLSAHPGAPSHEPFADDGDKGKDDDLRHDEEMKGAETATDAAPDDDEEEIISEDDVSVRDGGRDNDDGDGSEDPFAAMAPMRNLSMHPFGVTPPDSSNLATFNGGEDGLLPTGADGRPLRSTVAASRRGRGGGSSTVAGKQRSTTAAHLRHARSGHIEGSDTTAVVIDPTDDDTNDNNTTADEEEEACAAEALHRRVMAVAADPSSAPAILAKGPVAKGHQSHGGGDAHHHHHSRSPTFDGHDLAVVAQPPPPPPPADPMVDLATAAMKGLDAFIAKASYWMPLAESEPALTRIAFPTTVSKDFHKTIVRMRSLLELMLEALRTLRMDRHNNATGGSGSSSSSPSPMFRALLDDLGPLALGCAEAFGTVVDMMVMSLARRHAYLESELISASLRFEEQCMALHYEKSQGFRQLVKIGRIIYEKQIGRMRRSAAAAGGSPRQHHLLLASQHTSHDDMHLSGKFNLSNSTSPTTAVPYLPPPLINLGCTPPPPPPPASLMGLPNGTSAAVVVAADGDMHRRTVSAPTPTPTPPQSAPQSASWARDSDKHATQRALAKLGSGGGGGGSTDWNYGACDDDIRGTAFLLSSKRAVQGADPLVVGGHHHGHPLSSPPLSSSSAAPFRRSVSRGGGLPCLLTSPQRQHSAPRGGGGGNNNGSNSNTQRSCDDVVADALEAEEDRQYALRQALLMAQLSANPKGRFPAPLSQWGDEALDAVATRIILANEQEGGDAITSPAAASPNRRHSHSVLHGSGANHHHQHQHQHTSSPPTPSLRSATVGSANNAAASQRTVGFVGAPDALVNSTSPPLTPMRAGTTLHLPSSYHPQQQQHDHATQRQRSHSHAHSSHPQHHQQQQQSRQHHQRKLKMLMTNADSEGVHTFTFCLVIFSKEVKRLIMSVEGLQQHMLSLE